MLFACLFILALIIGLPIFVCLGIPPLVELLLAHSIRCLRYRLMT